MDVDAQFGTEANALKPVAQARECPVAIRPEDFLIDHGSRDCHFDGSRAVCTMQ